MVQTQMDEEEEAVGCVVGTRVVLARRATRAECDGKLSFSLLLRSRRWSAKGNAGRKVRVGIESKCLAGFSCNALVDEPIRRAGKERNGMGLKGLPRGREG